MEGEIINPETRSTKRFQSGKWAGFTLSYDPNAPIWTMPQWLPPGAYNWRDPPDEILALIELYVTSGQDKYAGLSCVEFIAKVTSDV